MAVRSYTTSKYQNQRLKAVLAGRPFFEVPTKEKNGLKGERHLRVAKYAFNWLDQSK
jgi:hypothetical protein